MARRGVPVSGRCLESGAPTSTTRIPKLGSSITVSTKRTRTLTPFFSSGAMASSLTLPMRRAGRKVCEVRVRNSQRQRQPNAGGSYRMACADLSPAFLKRQKMMSSNTSLHWLAEMMPAWAAIAENSVFIAQWRI